MSDSVTPWTAACQASLSITNSQTLPNLMSIESVMPSSHLILCRPLLLHPQSFPASGSLHQVAKVLELPLQHQSFQWYSGLISSRIDWFEHYIKCRQSLFYCPAVACAYVCVCMYVCVYLQIVPCRFLKKSLLESKNPFESLLGIHSNIHFHKSY